ncbi:hypothetical protein D3C74_295070 [compost metagenome]
MEEDPRLGLIMEYLEKKLPENWDSLDGWARRNYLDQPTGSIKRKQVSAMEIWVECFGNRQGDLKPRESRVIGGLIQKIPGWVEKKKRERILNYGKQTVFVYETDRNGQ